MPDLPPLILPGFPRPVPRWLAERHIPDLDRFAALLPELRILEAIDPEDGTDHRPQFWRWHQQGKLEAILQAQKQIMAISAELACLARAEYESTKAMLGDWNAIHGSAPSDAAASDYIGRLKSLH